MKKMGKALFIKEKKYSSAGDIRQYVNLFLRDSNYNSYFLYLWKYLPNSRVQQTTIFGFSLYFDNIECKLGVYSLFFYWKDHFPGSTTFKNAFAYPLY